MPAASREHVSRNPRYDDRRHDRLHSNIVAAFTWIGAPRTWDSGRARRPVSPRRTCGAPGAGLTATRLCWSDPAPRQGDSSRQGMLRGQAADAADASVSAPPRLCLKAGRQASNRAGHVAQLHVQLRVLHAHAFRDLRKPVLLLLRVREQNAGSVRRASVSNTPLMPSRRRHEYMWWPLWVAAHLDLGPPLVAPGLDPLRDVRLHEPLQPVESSTKHSEPQHRAQGPAPLLRRGRGRGWSGRGDSNLARLLPGLGRGARRRCQCWSWGRQGPFRGAGRRRATECLLDLVLGEPLLFQEILLRADFCGAAGRRGKRLRGGGGRAKLARLALLNCTALINCITPAFRTFGCWRKATALPIWSSLSPALSGAELSTSAMSALSRPCSGKCPSLTESLGAAGDVDAGRAGERTKDCPAFRHHHDGGESLRDRQQVSDVGMTTSEASAPKASAHCAGVTVSVGHGPSWLCAECLLTRVFRRAILSRPLLRPPPARVQRHTLVAFANSCTVRASLGRSRREVIDAKVPLSRGCCWRRGSAAGG